MAPTGDPKPTYPIQFWRLTCDGIEDGALFTEAQLPTLTFQNADLNHVGKESLPAKVSVAVNHSWSQVTFRKGIDTEHKMFKWCKEGLPQEGGGGGLLTKKELTVELCGGKDHKTTIQKWVFTGAWPSSYTPPSLNANSGEIAMESITFTFDEGRLDGA